MNANDTTEDRVTMLRELLDMAAQKVGEQRIRIKRLEALLVASAEFIEPYSDVSDGAYGIPVPNAAMALMSEILEALP